ncbi:Fic family protein [Mycobacterium hackensackense]|uniref:Fic family protein n=1 Tax=Mycobacterium hackensackense TaxID=228909 RepID=UPI002265F7F7|nr:Fic family protein [Mycobacterium hackensackense]MCV7255017.1 Fic family protein [Mycobacterium hackensackense]
MPSLGVPVPPVSYETLRWERKPDAPDLAAVRKQSGPYRAAVTAPIADLAVTAVSAVLADADDASREITRFDAELGSEIAPFAALLLRSESAASSRIENLTASARAIAEAELPGEGGGKRNAAEIVANTRAMAAAITLADNIDADAILAMHDALMADHAPAIAGRWRTEQVWIGGGNYGPVGALFVPPRHEVVAAAIDDLITFTKRDDIPALVHIAIAHAQFETIHPFPDGNGRTGRALVQAMLRHKGLTRQVTVPVSAGLLVDTDRYFDALTAFRTGDAAPIVERMSEASVLAVQNGRQLVSELRAVREGWDARISARRDSATWRIADLLMRRPVVNSAVLSAELGILIGNVPRYLEPLIDAGVVKEFTDRARNRAWRAPEVLDSLDAFAERAGRRGW